MKLSRTKLRELFGIKSKPSAANFWDLFDSFRHKDDSIEIASISGLTNSLANKLDVGAQNALINAFDEAISTTNFGKWIPVDTYQEYGAKRLKILSEYINGTGPSPTDHLGQYYAAVGGFTTNPALATDFNIGIIDGSVTTDKTDFAKKITIPKGKNILNPNLKKINKIVYLDGLLYDQAGYTTFFKIPVESNTKYACTGVSDAIYYDEYGIFIPLSYLNGPGLITTPTNAKYVSVSITDANLPSAQIEKGINQTSYELYSGEDLILIENLFKDPAVIENNSVSTEKTNFARSGNFPFGKNIIDTAYLLPTDKIVNIDGLVYDQSGYKTYFKIPVKSNNFYTFKGLYGIIWYDENGDFISYFSGVNTLKSPIGATFASISCNDSDFSTFQMEEGETESPYEEFKGVSGVKIDNLITDTLKQKGNEVIIGNNYTEKITVSGITMYYQNTNNNRFAAGAGNPNITGSGNHGYGFECLINVTTGITNVGFGDRALKNITTGSDHTAIGSGALEFCVGSVGNTAAGKYALRKCTGTNNSGVGDSSLEDLVFGLANSAIGYGAGLGIETANYSTFTGSYAGGWYAGANLAVRHMDFATITGAAALQKIGTNNHRNTLHGAFSMHIAETGEDNVTNGFETLRTLISGDRNTVSGNHSASNLVTGNDNAFYGYNSGLDPSLNGVVNGSTAIGSGVKVTRSNEVVIGKNTDMHFTIMGIEFTRAQVLALKALV